MQLVRSFSILFVITSMMMISGIAHAKTNTAPQRIISLSPSITEMVFALGLESNIVGVSKYSDFPTQAEQIPRVGGLIDINLEAILALQPDLVILSIKQQRSQQQLQKLNINTLSIRSDSLADIKTALHQIGEQTQHQQQAKQRIAHIEKIEAQVAKKLQSTSHTPTIMVTIGHSLNQHKVSKIYLSGQHDFYNDLITQAGGINVYQGNTPAVPSLTMEGIIQLNPDIIIDVFPEADDHNYDLKQVRQQWQSMPYLKAIKNQQLHIIEQNYATIPGPRIIKLLVDFARIIHPEINWEDIAP